MREYEAGAPIYLSKERRLIAAGERFCSDEQPGLAWIALGTEPTVAAPRRAATPRQRADTE